MDKCFGSIALLDLNFLRIITYVLLCGYSPFRSDDVKQLIKETTEAKIEFHERYWKNISQTGLCQFRSNRRFSDVSIVSQGFYHCVVGSRPK